MINTKRFFYAFTPGSAMFLAVIRVADGFYLQSADGTFDASQDTLSMTEYGSSGAYYLDESRAVWSNGLYDVVFYNLGTVAPGSGYEFTVTQDQILSEVALVALAAKTAVSQTAAALKLIKSDIENLTRQISLLTGQVNDYTSQSRRSNGST